MSYEVWDLGVVWFWGRFRAELYGSGDSCRDSLVGLRLIVLDGLSRALQRTLLGLVLSQLLVQSRVALPCTTRLDVYY